MKHNPWKRSNKDQYGVHHCKDCESLCAANEMRGGRCEHCAAIEENNGWDEYQQHSATAQARLDEWQDSL